jgi:hypothetical protein
MTGVGIDTKSVSNSMHKQWLDFDQLSDDQRFNCTIEDSLWSMEERARQPARPTTSRVDKVVVRMQ